MIHLRPKIGQSLCVGIQGHSLTDEEKRFLIDYQIGGVVLFARNVHDPKQIADLTREIQSLRLQTSEKLPFFIGIDMEGGRVARLKGPFTKWPSLQKLGKLNSPTVAFQFGESMGRELRAVGINLNFAPSVDVLTNPNNTAIGDRSLGTDFEIVAKLGSAIVRGYLKADILACVKHFPGHGNTVLDSHDDLPKEELSFEDLEAGQMAVFKKVFRSRVDLVMSSHILFPQVDPEWPVTLSKKWLDEVLRGHLGYRELVITDDLDMKGLRNHYSVEQIAVRAVQAGANILLYCNEPASPVLAVEAIEKAIDQKTIKPVLIESSYTRIVQLKREKLQNPDPLQTEIAQTLIGHPQHLALAQAIEDGRILESREA